MIHKGKQNHRCHSRHRQFVLNPQNKLISNETKALIDKLLLEKMPLAGIARVVEISLQAGASWKGENRMSTNISVEQRLAILEATVDDLQKKLASSQSPNWLQQVTGSFKDEPAFEEVLAYGRAIREADHPLTEKQVEL
jgi:hypothetical protein